MIEEDEVRVPAGTRLVLNGTHEGGGLTGRTLVVCAKSEDDSGTQVQVTATILTAATWQAVFSAAATLAMLNTRQVFVAWLTDAGDADPIYLQPIHFFRAPRPA